MIVLFKNKYPSRQTKVRADRLREAGRNEALNSSIPLISFSERPHTNRLCSRSSRIGNSIARGWSRSWI